MKPSTLGIGSFTFENEAIFKCLGVQLNQLRIARAQRQKLNRDILLLELNGGFGAQGIGGGFEQDFTLWLFSSARHDQFVVGIGNSQGVGTE